MSNMLPAFNVTGHRAARYSSPDEDEVIACLCKLEMGDDDWSDAGLPQLLEYVYGAKGLQIPLKWQACFPTSHFM